MGIIKWTTTQNHMPNSLSTELANAVKSDESSVSGFPARLREVPYDWKEDGIEVSGKFFYLAFKSYQPSIDEFIDFIYWQIIPFCISRKEISEKRQRNDYRAMHELTDKAKNLFIKAKNSKKTSGEIGELILFTILESLLKAPQLVCKMSLKTSENMPVHGTDGIHVRVGSQQDRLSLMWGESKLYQQISKALDDICSSLSEFSKENEGRATRDRDIDIIQEHIDIVDPELRSLLINYFDPYSEEANFLEEEYACFIGFDYNKYEQINDIAAKDREEFFKTEYSKRLESACRLFGEKIRSHNLSHLKINFFLVPFPSVEVVRNKFFDKLGVGQ